MKFALSLLTLTAVVLTFSGCNTLVTRRDLYSPAVGNGPWTKARGPVGIAEVSHNEYYHPKGADEGIFGISNSDNRYR